jgi:hypothetical protein
MVLERHRLRLRRRRGVVAVDVGVSLRRGRPTRTPAIRIHVERKLPLAELPPGRTFASSIEGVPVDVIEAVYAPLACLADGWVLRIYRNPLIGGVAIGGSGLAGFGTLGAVLLDKAGAPAALTAAHVVRGAKEVLQPPSIGEPIGRVADSVIDRSMDAAVVALEGDRDAIPGLHGIGGISGVFDPIPPTRLPLPVRFVGACTGRGRGFVTSTALSLSIDYGGLAVTLANQLHIVGRDGRELSRPGDSGALVLEEGSGLAVGLLFAGEPKGASDFGVATPIRRILDRFAVTIP